MRRSSRTRLLIVVLPVAACAGESEPLPRPARIEAVPLQARSRGGSTLFEELGAEHTGVRLENRFEWGHPLEHLYPHGFAGGGVCIGDYDADGLPDVYLTSQTGRDALYRNLGDLQFEDASDRAGLPDERDWGSGAAFADVDGDGDLDLYVCNYDAPNRLWRNRGDGTFEDASAEAGVDFRGASVMASFADYDRDSDLDLHLLTNRIYAGGGLDDPSASSKDGKIEPGQEELFALQERRIGGEVQKYVVMAGQRDRLYRNEDGGRFREVGVEAGLLGNHPGLSATWWDHDEDGWPDLYVCNDFWDPDQLWHNQRDGTFRDVTGEVLPHTTWFSMGSDAADVDGDGRIDFLAADMAPTTHYMSKLMMGDMNESRWFLESAEPRQYMRNSLYLATGTGRCMEVAYLAGLAQTDWTWSVKFGDLDVDGDQDLFVSTGTANHSFDPDLTRAMSALAHREDLLASPDPLAVRKAQWALYREKPPRFEKNLAFENRGELDFARAEDRWGLDQETVSFGAALSDLDRDGDLDLVVNDVGAPARVYRNGASGGHALLIRLVAEGDGWGTGTRVRADGVVRELYPTSGYMSANEPLVHIGLGDADRVSNLYVRWPSGRTDEFEDVPADRLLTIREGSAPPPQPRDVRWPTNFEEATERFDLALPVQPETPYDDYRREPLLPQKLSHPGPGLALGDVDGDGDDDLYVGGPAGQSGRLLLAGPDGRFALVPGGPWEKDRAREDTAVLFFDTDSDGDLDLFVGSGSVECPPNDPMLRDRLYVNAGGGAFVKAGEGGLPDERENTGAAAIGDVDQDGDLDLFIGARSIPGRYPLVPRSHLLRNDGGRFADVTEELAPGLAQAGLVTSALFSDADGDGRSDLLVACEWGPIRMWRNTGGALADCTEAAGLAPYRGWWSGLTAADLDQDGDTDYVALNAGLNTKYRASPEKPTLLYYGDFEGQGKCAIVEAKHGKDGELPVRGLSCSSEAMPFVREKLPTYAQFARAQLPEIYEPARLQGAMRLEVTHLESGVFWNRTDPSDGRIALEFEPFPRPAQAAPGYGAVAGDLDFDGRTDVFFAQNYYWREPETGRWDGGLGAWIRRGGRLEVVPHSTSGLVVPGDARATVLGDLDGDSRPEILVARNGMSPLAFRATDLGSHDEQRLAVRLLGPPGNTTAIGARVRVQSGDHEASAEVHGTSGYLSQSAPWLFFRGGTGSIVRVRWPGGRETERRVEAGEHLLVLEMP